jgi:type VI secretion system protein ImpH
MGLYGGDAAVPSHLIDDIVLRRDGHEVVMAFLDIYHYRLVTLLYRAWRKYRYPVGFEAGGADERSRDLLALAGFALGDKPAGAGLPDSRTLALMGLLNQRTRTAEGLAGVVALAVPGIAVEVEEFHPTWITVAAPAHLGGSLRDDDPDASRGLGHGDVLGRRIRCRTKAVRITLCPTNAAQVEALLPGSTSHRDLLAFLRIYIGVKADALLRMRVSSSLMPNPQLGESRSRLAWTMLLKPTAEQTFDVQLGRYEAFPSV